MDVRIRILVMPTVLVGEKVSVGLVSLEGGGFGGEGGFSADGVGNTFVCSHLCLLSRLQ